MKGWNRLFGRLTGDFGCLPGSRDCIHAGWARTHGVPCDRRRLELKRLSHVLVALATGDRDGHAFAHALALARRHDAKLLLVFPRRRKCP
jgi:hypothetical protein